MIVAEPLPQIVRELQLEYDDMSVWVSSALVNMSYTLQPQVVREVVTGAICRVEAEQSVKGLQLQRQQGSYDAAAWARCQALVLGMNTLLPEVVIEVVPVSKSQSIASIATWHCCLNTMLKTVPCLPVARDAQAMYHKIRQTRLTRAAVSDSCSSRFTLQTNNFVPDGLSRLHTMTGREEALEDRYLKWSLRWCQSRCQLELRPARAHRWHL